MRPLRYAGGRRAHGFKPIEELDDFDRLHIAAGRKLIRAWSEEDDLRDTPERWEELWAFYREELLAEWIGRRPGTRPPAWWAFEELDEPIVEGEAERDYLDRLRLLSADELEGVRRKAVELAEYDRGRDSRRTAAGFYPDHWIPPDDLHCFAARKGLLTESERQALHLDARGERTDRPPEIGPK